MGVWGYEPWENDAAADWFASVFEGIDIGDRVREGLDDENPDRSRAAAHLLLLLGNPYVWPGAPAGLAQLIDKAILRMESLASNREYLARFEDSDSLLISVGNLVGDLQTLRNSLKSPNE
jgi:hypothetical protein